MKNQLQRIGTSAFGMKQTIARSNTKGKDAMEKRMSHNLMKQGR
jgi:hypothetical protein